MASILTDEHYNTWSILTRYKMLADKINDLKTQAWLDLPPSEEIETSLAEAEAELQNLKQWIEFNYDVKPLD